MGNSSGKPVVFTDEVNLNHFRLLRVVGKGAFGKVRIVERKDTGITFALKYIRKDEIVRSESVRNIIRERRMLEQLQHPFLCNLRYSFQDIEYMYIVVDLMQGGDLRFHISRKTFTEEAVRFWMAELACALRYIHKKGIVHRDVKPDNVLLDSEGHVHLADFNVASDFSSSKPLTSKSGTLAYLAPEAYEGRGYLSEVDWWSLGVTFYECIYNKRPFEGGNQNSLAARIVKARPPYPKTNPPVSAPCLHAISSLLEKDRRRRIGAAGFSTFTDNPFFQPLDFDALEHKEIAPTFVPSTEKTNFDATYDLEELLLEEAPLEARAKRQKPRSALKQDATREEIRADQLHRVIETMFLPYDYTRAVNEDDVKADLSLPSDADPSIVAHFTDSAAEKGMHVRKHHNDLDPHPRHLPGSRGRQSAHSPTPGTPNHSRSPTLSQNGSPAPLTSREVQEYVLHPGTSDPFPLAPEPSDLTAQFSDGTSGPDSAQYKDHFQFQQHHLSRLQPQTGRNSWHQANLTLSEERELDRASERDMDREILVELDLADQQRSRTSSSVGPNLASLSGGPGAHGDHTLGVTAKIYSATARHPYDKVLGHERLNSPTDSGRNSPVMPGPVSRQHSAGRVMTPSVDMSRNSIASRHGPPPEDMHEERSTSSKPIGVLRFLDRKRGRDRSPKGDGSERPKDGKKTKEKERGVLGKEGARVIISNG